MSIYVEAHIHGSMDDLWRKTQDPQLHEKWDARFTSIKYLPRENELEPQRFLYATRIGFGVSIDGEGETVDNRDDGGRRTSSLRFWSDDPKSLIREGAGYWQYIPVEDGIRFITGYDYKPRFGWIGRAFDRLVFQPLIGWATAWSFDRLRLWIEKDIHPAVSMERSVIHAISRITVALVWLYQGLVPKLIANHADELVMLADSGITEAAAPTVIAIVGAAEVLLGMNVLVFFRRRWPLMLTALLMVLATLGVVLNSPGYLMAAFNPVSLNLLLFVVAVIGLFVMKELPSATRCLRKKPETN